MGATDLRKSIDGLAILVINGFWLHYKRLEKGTFKWPNNLDSKTLLLVKEN